MNDREYFLTTSLSYQLQAARRELAGFRSGEAWQKMRADYEGIIREKDLAIKKLQKERDEFSFSRRKITKQWLDVLEDVRKEYEKETARLKKVIAELLDMVASLKNRNSELDEKRKKADLKTDIDSLSYAIGMARTEGLDQYLAQQGIDSTQMSEFLKGFNEGAAKIDKKDVAYMAGLQVGQMVSKQWVEGFNQQIFGNDSTQSISRENLLAGFVAGVIGKGGAMDMMKAQEYMRTQMDAIKEKATAEKYADNKAAGEKFLAENKAKEGVVTTPSGLQYKIITKGNGAVPADSSKVKVNYKGTLIDGTEFDSSYKRNEPATFRANQVIKGWTEALTMMPVGSKWELYIPYDLAYGSRETGSQIKPFSTLIFEVELLGIEK